MGQCRCVFVNYFSFFSPYHATQQHYTQHIDNDLISIRQIKKFPLLLNKQHTNHNKYYHIIRFIFTPKLARICNIVIKFGSFDLSLLFFHSLNLNGLGSISFRLDCGKIFGLCFFGVILFSTLKIHWLEIFEKLDRNPWLHRPIGIWLTNWKLILNRFNGPK